MEVFTPIKDDKSSMTFKGMKVNNYSYKKLSYRFGVYKQQLASGENGKEFWSKVVNLYFELRFMCLQTPASVELSKRVYRFLVRGLQNEEGLD